MFSSTQESLFDPQTRGSADTPHATPSPASLDLSFYLEPPELTSRAELTITPLAPLSMVSSQPGTYFLSEMAPTTHMVLGMLENALGWHFHKDLRNELRKELAKLAKKNRAVAKTYKGTDWLAGKLAASGSGYESLLVHHVRLSPKHIPQPALSYDDLWSMLNRRDDDTFDTGSRNYDISLEAYVSAFNSAKASNKQKGAVKRQIEWDKKAIRSKFPQFYYSPTKRGYCELCEDNGANVLSAFVYTVHTTSLLNVMLSHAIDSPAGPLYVGTNDGWVDTKWEQL